MNDRPKRNTPAGEAPHLRTNGEIRRHCRGPRKAPHGFVGRGGAAERVSFAACGETNDTQLETTRQEAFSGRAATESKMEETHEREPI